ncbi:hypothetical protein Tco_1351010 [Tanacetum coccineum]
MMGGVEGDDIAYFHNGGDSRRLNRRREGGEDKVADVGFFNSFEDDFDDQDLYLDLIATDYLMLLVYGCLLILSLLLLLLDL